MSAYVSRTVYSEASILGGCFYFHLFNERLLRTYRKSELGGPPHPLMLYEKQLRLQLVLGHTARMRQN